MEKDREVAPGSTANASNDAPTNNIPADAINTNLDLESGKESISHWQMLVDQGVLTRQIINYDYEGSGTDEDPYVVEWIDNDPRNPMTWTKKKKWIITLTVANAVLVVSFCSSAFSGGTVFCLFLVSTSIILTLARHCAHHAGIPC